MSHFFSALFVIWALEVMEVGRVTFEVFLDYWTAGGAANEGAEGVGAVGRGVDWGVAFCGCTHCCGDFLG